MTKDAPFLGIDFGTSQSSMAWFNPRTGHAEVVRNAEGEEKTPSVVYFGDDETLVGKPAEDLLEDEAERPRILAGVKRSLARSIRYAVGNRHVRPVEVVAEILRKLRRDAEELHFRSPVERAVVTHPATFDQVENDLLIEAARAAGFADVELLPEPVAAAVAYAESGLDVGEQVLVYDLGAGTFDVALLGRGDAEEPFSLAAEPLGLRCGGDDFDQALYDHCEAIARQTLGRPIAEGDRADLRFLRECRRRKENLSSRPRSDFSSYLSGGVPFRHGVDRETFEGLIRPAVEPTIELTRRMLEQAGAGDRRPGSIVLIGGSSQVPLIERLLRERLGVEAIRWQGRDLAVALGAAFHARRHWMKRWRIDPVATRCPSCHVDLALNLTGAVRCTSCRWDFEIDDQGDVVAGRPIATACPSCAREMQLRRPGQARCPSCRWDFEIDPEGGVVAGRPIVASCPRCSSRWQVRQAGPQRCSGCEWEFGIDERGEVVSGRPIRPRCPSCSESLLFARPGRVSCEKCRWDFEFDDAGRVVSGAPIPAQCPKCSHRWHAREAGWHRCPECAWGVEIDASGAIVAGLPIASSCPKCGAGSFSTHRGPVECAACRWEYEIDDRGALVGGHPIATNCPRCRSLQHFRTSGTVLCGSCGRKFEIASDGEVLATLRLKALGDPFDEPLLRRYIERRTPEQREADRAIAQTAFLMRGISRCWREKLTIGATGGYVTGAVAGLALGVLLFFALNSKESGAAGLLIFLWIVATGIGAVAFAMAYDDAESDEIRRKFHQQVQKCYEGTAQGFKGSSLGAALGVTAAFLTLALPVALVVILLVGALLVSLIGPVLGFAVFALMAGAIGAGIGYLVGLAISALWGVARGATLALRAASMIRGRV